MRKSHLDRRVAVVLGIPVSDVSLITSTFLTEVMKAITEGDPVLLEGFGRFTLRKMAGLLTKLQNPKGQAILVSPTDKFRVTFKKSHTFNALVRAKYGTSRVLKESEMEKYAVDEGVDQNAMEKAATQGCPECGAKCERHGSLVVCPRCGSEPFEKK